MKRIFLGSLLILIGLGISRPTFLGIATPIYALTGLALLVWGIASAVRVSAQNKAVTNDATYSHSSGKTAIAIDVEKKVIRLKDGKASKQYPFSDVRQWRTNISSGGEMLATGIALGSYAIGNNIRVARENRRQTGLFVSVRDIETPEWRIEMPNEKDQKRWMEILRQTINND